MRFPCLLLLLSSRLAITAAADAQNSKPNHVEFTITAAPTRLSLQPGDTSDVFAYSGSVPGPNEAFHLD